MQTSRNKTKNEARQTDTSSSSLHHLAQRPASLSRSAEQPASLSNSWPHVTAIFRSSSIPHKKTLSTIFIAVIDATSYLFTDPLSRNS